MKPLCEAVLLLGLAGFPGFLVLSEHFLRLSVSIS